MTTAIGRAGDPSAVRSLRLGDVVATYVVDGVLAMRPDTFFPGAPSEYWSTRPELLTPRGEMLMSAGGLLIEHDGKTLLIDAGVGTMTTEFAFGGVDCGSMIDVLDAIGRRPEDVDVVAFTHLHFDHAGWAFTNGAKTFPNARYVLAAKEWAPHATGRHRADITTPRHVISRLAADSSSLDLINDGDDILPNVRAVVTPGHSPGHTSYVITSGAGQRLVALGDAFHTPAQMTHPQWLSAADSDATGVQSARRRLLAELAEPNTVGFGFHFGDQAFGRVVTDDTGAASWEPVPTSVLAAPPRLPQ
jgi:glyoxylase-like metal-dependent hydrolase (beta-lactamase superfamily II)